MITDKTKIRRNPNLIGRNVGNQFVLVEIRKGKLFRLNPVAEIVWKYVWKKRTVHEVLQKVVHTFDVRYETAKKDMLDFLELNRGRLFFMSLDK